MGTSEGAMCKKYGQEEISSYHILCPVLARHKIDIFGSAWIVQNRE
jgi:hypothetical protein